MPECSIYFGEIGLFGEIKKVHEVKTRIKEAKKLDFSKVICSKLANDFTYPISN